jgi:glucose/arabinose dehydrogenase
MKLLSMIPWAAAAAWMLAVSPPSARAQATPTAEPPAFTVATVASGLRGPWDIAFAPGGAMCLTEKCHGLSVRLSDGRVLRLMGNAADFALRADDLFCQGQSGVHGVAVDPRWADGQRFVYVFSASNLNTQPRTNRVIRLAVSSDLTRVSERTDIVSDIAFKEAARLGGPGAHSGGRLRFGPDGYLWITTGDNHHPDVPQDPKMLGGKVLRIDRDGKPALGNAAPPGFDPRIFTYGHRNPQGIAFRPGSSQVYTAEHGPNHSDEVTQLVAGGNAGWDPRDRPQLNCREGYCGYSGTVQTMPMTDLQRFPKAMPALWNNRERSEGTGPAEFLSGTQWGAWNGALAVALMRSQRVDLLQLDAAGKLVQIVTVDMPAQRIRSLVQGPDGALWGTTDDGQLLRMQLRR